MAAPMAAGPSGLAGLRLAVWEAPGHVPLSDPFLYTLESPPDVTGLAAANRTIAGPKQIGNVCGRCTPPGDQGQYIVRCLAVRREQRPMIATTSGKLLDHGVVDTTTCGRVVAILRDRLTPLRVTRFPRDENSIWIAPDIENDR